MLRLILDRSEAAVPPESMFLIDVDRSKAPADVLRDAWNHPRVRLWGLGGEPPPMPAALSGDEATRFALSAPFVAYARKEGKTRWGDKTPAYVGHVDTLAAIWPDARFVVLVRDGRDVALSVTKVPFGANNVWAAARSWAGAVRRGREAAARYPDRVLTLRYEDLVADPERHIATACNFLGLTFDADMLAIERSDRSKVLEDQSGWFTQIWTGITTSGAGKWRREMTPHQQAVFERAAGRELAELGYETGSEARTATALATPPYAAHDAAMRLANFVRLRIVQERGREVRHVLRRKLSR